MSYDIFFGDYVDEYGNPIERTPNTHPYNYDGFVTSNFRSEKPNNTVWSDRLLHWDWDKYNKCSEEVFGNRGQIFYDRNPKDVEVFLQKYFDDKNLKLVRIMQYCNQSSGYPVWRFDIVVSKQ